jgi:hypothetical protein
MFLEELSRDTRISIMSPPISDIEKLKQSCVASHRKNNAPPDKSELQAAQLNLAWLP